MAAIGSATGIRAVGQKQPVVESPESSRIMPLALFMCLQGLAEYLVLDAGWKYPKV